MIVQLLVAALLALKIPTMLFTGGASRYVRLTETGIYHTLAYRVIYQQGCYVTIKSYCHFGLEQRSNAIINATYLC